MYVRIFGFHTSCEKVKVVTYLCTLAMQMHMFMSVKQWSNRSGPFWDTVWVKHKNPDEVST